MRHKPRFLGARAILNAVKVAHHAASDKLVARIEAVIASGRRLARLPDVDLRRGESTCAGVSGNLEGRALGDRVEREGFGRQQVLELVRGSLADILEISPDRMPRVPPSATWAPTRSLSSSWWRPWRKSSAGRTAEFRIDDDDLEDLKTVRDAVDYVVAKLGSAS